MPPHAALVLAITVFTTLVVASRTAAIVNGVEDVTDEFANVGSLVVTAPLPVTHPDLEVPVSFSTGTLIHPRIMLTAGHSIAFMDHLTQANGINRDDFLVTFNRDAHDPDSFLEIDTVVVHELFAKAGPGESSVDVAVVILKQPVEDITPVTLPCAGLLDRLVECGKLKAGPNGGTPLAIVGYGIDAPPPLALLGIPDGIRRWGFAGYLSLQGFYLTLSQNIGLGESAVTNGDSGGPAFWYENGQRVQVGITSFLGAGMGKFCRTDTPEVLDFLQSIVVE
jgi:secreted trypsin-like serine protease